MGVAPNDFVPETRVLRVILASTLYAHREVDAARTNATMLAGRRARQRSGWLRRSTRKLLAAARTYRHRLAVQDPLKNEQNDD